jgi:hypothetical protein
LTLEGLEVSGIRERVFDALFDVHSVVSSREDLGDEEGAN